MLPRGIDPVARGAAVSDSGRRALVQENRHLGKPAGTVGWEEHVLAWTEYAQRYGHGRSAERMAERGGFCYAELCDYLGHEPKTWEPR